MLTSYRWPLDGVSCQDSRDRLITMPRGRSLCISSGGDINPSELESTTCVGRVYVQINFSLETNSVLTVLNTMKSDSLALSKFYFGLL
ncbi:hypothetical protein PILCRDRAFT_491575 [Piloderma croceum F 1598]|uniref:Uncharacterized protein n=1 Tax=Piloderma croceum (strain F 1598) TaxID=765440 RepID=A0A0C3BWU3_PILCF|nr:hypothetical protein PILCRDRAFT_491575 [Piloderma croceum F 1598]